MKILQIRKRYFEPDETDVSSVLFQLESGNERTGVSYYFCIMNFFVSEYSPACIL